MSGPLEKKIYIESVFTSVIIWVIWAVWRAEPSWTELSLAEMRHVLFLFFFLSCMLLIGFKIILQRKALCQFTEMNTHFTRASIPSFTRSFDLASDTDCISRGDVAIDAIDVSCAGFSFEKCLVQCFSQLKPLKSLYNSSS